MGEEKWRVSWVGEPALTEIDLEPGIDVYSRLQLEAGAAFVLATYHPTSYETLTVDEQASAFVELLGLIQHDIVLTAPNPDPGSATFLRILRDFAAMHENVHLFENLGADFYHAAMARAQFMIGNSSSGIIEAASFKLPVVNIGNRQNGRLAPANVIHTGSASDEILAAVRKACTLEFRHGLDDLVNPYGDGNAAPRMVAALRELDLSDPALIQKDFQDI